MPISPTTRQQLTKSSGSFTFYLGTDIPRFLSLTNVPLFISRRSLSRIRHPRSYTQWALDSGGFTELSMYGRWVTSPGKYASQARYWYDTVQGLQWCAVQDWMCEPLILAKTGLTVAYHQRLTIESYFKLREYQPRVPWLPVLQGYKPDEYMDHLRQYEQAGIDLTTLPIVGVGSVCRRQSKDVDQAELIIKEIHSAGIRLHAFGFKTTGLARCSHLLTSADSMAWSYTARMQKIKLPECTHRGVCNHCLTWALQWRDKVLDKLHTTGDHERPEPQNPVTGRFPQIRPITAWPLK